MRRRSVVATAAFVAAAVLLLRQESRDGRYLDSSSAGPLGTQTHGAAVRGGIKVLPRPLVTPRAAPFSKPVCRKQVKRACAWSVEGAEFREIEPRGSAPRTPQHIICYKSRVTAASVPLQALS